MLRPTVMDVPIDEDDVSAQTGPTLLRDTLRVSFLGEALRESRRRAST